MSRWFKDYKKFFFVNNHLPRLNFLWNNTLYRLIRWWWSSHLKRPQIKVTFDDNFFFVVDEISISMWAHWKWKHIHNHSNGFQIIFPMIIIYTAKCLREPKWNCVLSESYACHVHNSYESQLPIQSCNNQHRKYWIRVK